MALSHRPTKPTKRALSKLCERYLALPASTRIGRAIRIAATQAFWRRYSSYGSDARHYQPRFLLFRLILYRYSPPQLSSSRSSRFKLASTGLDFPQIPAAFSDDAHAREAIMQASLVRAAQSRSRDSFDAVIYVGDGVWDARAARNLGFRFIGISHEPARVECLYA